MCLPKRSPNEPGPPLAPRTVITILLTLRFTVLYLAQLICSFSVFTPGNHLAGVRMFSAPVRVASFLFNYLFGGPVSSCSRVLRSGGAVFNAWIGRGDHNAARGTCHGRFLPLHP